MRNCFFRNCRTRNFEIDFSSLYIIFTTEHSSVLGERLNYLIDNLQMSQALLDFLLLPIQVFITGALSVTSHALFPALMISALLIDNLGR